MVSLSCKTKGLGEKEENKNPCKDMLVAKGAREEIWERVAEKLAKRKDIKKIERFNSNQKKR